MNEVELSPEAEADISKHLNAIKNLSEQIRALEAQRIANIKAVNYIWKSEWRRDMLSVIAKTDSTEAILSEKDPPDLINPETGDILSIQNGIVLIGHKEKS